MQAKEGPLSSPTQFTCSQKIGKGVIRVEIIYYTEGNHCPETYNLRAKLTQHKQSFKLRCDLQSTLKPWFLVPSSWGGHLKECRVRWFVGELSPCPLTTSPTTSTSS